MKTFVTGGTSSIGRVLVKEYSRQGEDLRLLVRPSSLYHDLQLPHVELVYGDVTDPEQVRQGMQGCESVVHMAAIVGHDVSEAEWWRVNRDGSRNVLQAACDCGVASMVQVSSLSVLGSTQPGETADESRPIEPQRYVNLYQKTKFAADEIARDFAARGLNVKIVYPGFGFGCSKAASHPSLQDQTLLRMAAGKPVVVMGSGQNRLCLAYYNDTVSGIRLAQTRGNSGEGYLLGNESLTFPEIWTVIAQVLGKQAPQLRIPVRVLKTISKVSAKLRGKPIFPPDFFDMVGLNWCFSSRKAQSELGWQPHSFNDAVLETWQAYQAQGWKSK